MIKQIPCDKCNGTGKITIRVCDSCGSANTVGSDPETGRDICQDCWAAKLTGEELKNL